MQWSDGGKKVERSEGYDTAAQHNSRRHKGQRDDSDIELFHNKFVFVSRAHL